MNQAYIQTEFSLTTEGRGWYEITAQLNALVSEQGIQTGICHCWLMHTSASLLVTENADPDVRTDLETFFADLVSDGDRRFRHRAEGADDMPAHVRAALTMTELSIPIRRAALGLGTWQGVYLWEHRYRRHQRRLLLTLTGC